MSGETRDRSESSTYPSTQGWTALVSGSQEHGFEALPDPLPWGGQYMGNEISTMTDVVSSNFSSRIQNGEVINNPMKKTTIKTMYGAPGTWEHIYHSPNGLWCAEHGVNHDKYYKHCGVWRPSSPGFLGIDPSIVASYRDAVIGNAVTKAHASVDVSEMQTLATAAESRKTIDSMASILMRVYRIAKKVRKFELRAIRAELSPRELADMYMAARYAIRPLIYDAKGVVRARQKDRGDFRKAFRGEASDSGTFELDPATDVTFASLLKGSWSRRCDWSVSARAGVLCDVSITDATVFGIDQLAETAWELVPFSFIVDWFVNVGDWIAARSPNAGINQLASWVTVKSSFTEVLTVSDAYSTAPQNGYVLDALLMPSIEHKQEELVLERIIDPEMSTWPEFNLKLDVFKILDLGVILQRVMSKRR